MKTEEILKIKDLTDFRRAKKIPFGGSLQFYLSSLIVRLREFERLR